MELQLFSCHLVLSYPLKVVNSLLKLVSFGFQCRYLFLPSIYFLEDFGCLFSLGVFSIKMWCGEGCAHALTGGVEMTISSSGGI